MVNASLNWASIVGIVLAVGGAMLYFMRSFKPALARDYDVFFAAIGLLCGGILFFQGWRLDPILQFGQFLLAGTTVFFAYESVRLRGVATEQARRSAYFDDEPAPLRNDPGSGGLRGGWDEDYDRFDEPRPLRRRFSGREDMADERAPEELYNRPRQVSRAAIPEEAASRRARNTEESSESWDRDGERSRRMARFRAGEPRNDRRPDFGDRRTERDEQRRGSRPMGKTDQPIGERTRPSAEDAAFSPSRRASSDAQRNAPLNRSQERFTASSRSGTSTAAVTGRTTPRSSRPRENTPRNNSPRDNSSRFDD